MIEKESEFPSINKMGIEKALETSYLESKVFVNGQLVEVRFPYGQISQWLKEKRQAGEKPWVSLSLEDEFRLVCGYCRQVEQITLKLRSSFAALESPMNEEGVCELFKIAEYRREKRKDEFSTTWEEQQLMFFLFGNCLNLIMEGIRKDQGNIVYNVFQDIKPPPYFLIRNEAVGSGEELLVFSMLVTDDLGGWVMQSRQAGTVYKMVDLCNNNKIYGDYF